MDLEPFWRRIDGLAAGRGAQEPVPMPDDARVRRAFRVTTALLVAAALLSTGSIATALVLTEERHPVSVLVWSRCSAVMGISFTLFYFAWRARLGHRWAYRRLRLFSRIFPVVALALAAVPGLYPQWVVVEQLLFAGLLVAVSVALHAEPLRTAFAPPASG